MGKQDRLEDYRTKRDVRRSGEPAGKATASSKGGRTSEDLDGDD
jgi:hypothetical protein